MAGTIWPQTVEEVVADLDDAMQKFETARQAANDGILAAQVKRSMETMNTAESATLQLAQAWARLRALFAAVAAREKEYRAQVGLVQAVYSELIGK